MVVHCMPFVIINGKRDWDGGSSQGSTRKSPRMIEGKDRVPRGLPEDGQSPLMTASWPEKAERDGKHCKWSQDRPPTPGSWLLSRIIIHPSGRVGLIQ
jgi:hypothetical protein